MRTATLPFVLTALAGLAASCSPSEEDAPGLTSSVPETFANPPELAPNAAGVYELHMAASEVKIGGKRYCLRAYNGVVPGPTLRIAAGQERRVRVELHNDLKTVDGREVSGQEGHEKPSCHDFNLTNLHFHGGHVQPNLAAADPADPCEGEGCGADQRYHGDDVLITVGQGKMAQYRWDIDEDGTHHEGTNWYHPHIHGATAIQVTGGAAGALIVEGALDALPSIKSLRERVMMLNEMPLTDEHLRPLAEGEACSEATLSVNNFLSVTEGMPILMNGMIRPRITTAPGQIERWRMIYAGTPDEMAMKLHEGKDADCNDYDEGSIVQLVQYARDGITLPRYFARDAVWVSPGYRVDAFAPMPPRPSTLCLVGRRVHDLKGTVLAVVDVREDAGPATATSIPDEAEVTALAPPTTFAGKVDGVDVQASCEAIQTIHQRVGLLMPPVPAPSPVKQSEGASCDPSHHHAASASVCECPAPNINCRSFEARRARGYRSDRVAVAGTTEKWQIVALDGHPYHIHINPFLVCPNDSNKEPNFAHWRDTFWVQLEDGPREVLMNFKKFTGTFVQHCHKLNHEDEGMMELTELCAPDDLECLCQRLDDGKCVSQAGCQVDDLQCQFAAQVTAAYPAPAPKDPAICGLP